MGSGARVPGFQILPLPLKSFVTMAKLLHFSVSQSSHLPSGAPLYLPQKVVLDRWLLDCCITTYHSHFIISPASVGQLPRQGWAAWCFCSTWLQLMSLRDYSAGLEGPRGLHSHVLYLGWHD